MAKVDKPNHEIECDYCLGEGVIFNGNKLISCPKCKSKKKIPKEYLNSDISEFDMKIYGEKKKIR